MRCFSLPFRWVYDTSERAVDQVVSEEQAYLFLTRYRQRGQQTFFRQFWVDYSRFCSTPFAFRHSLKPMFPRAPNLSVADYVVRNHCGIWALGSGPARSQSKKVAKVNSVCLKRLQSNRNLRRWIAPLSTMKRKFYNLSRKRTLCSSLHLYLCLSPFYPFFNAQLNWQRVHHPVVIRGTWK